MLIDIIFLVILVMAIWKGMRKGFILAVFSVIALMAGLAVAIKFSALTASYLKDSVHLSAKWLSIISFIVTFMLAAFIVRLVAKAIEKTIELGMLGWVNRIAGILLYACIYMIIFSVLLFYLDKIHLISKDAMAMSRTYSFIKPWGPAAVDSLGYIIPAFKNMFFELEQFFASIHS